MINKIINFLLVIALSLVNMLIMVLPLFVLTLPIFLIFRDATEHFFLNAAVRLLFLISGYMLLYIVLDFIFGFTVNAYTKGCIYYKEAGIINGSNEIAKGFDYLKQRFNQAKVNLYISQTSEINAYAIGSMRKKAVVITVGLLNQIYNTAEDKNKYINQIVAILAHEMSHLVNKDFLPGMLVYSNQIVSNFLAKLFHSFFNILSNIVWVLPGIGSYISYMFIYAYKALDWLINLFYKTVFRPIYDVIYKWFSRGMEYRCDRDAAKIVGGTVMAAALSSIGPGSYFSIFSTHPRTKSRIRNIEKIKPKQGIIKASFLGNIVNSLVIILLIIITYYLYNLVKLNDANQITMQIYNDINMFKYKIMVIFSSIKNQFAIIKH